MLNLTNKDDFQGLTCSHIFGPLITAERHPDEWN